jgi:mono/diheme cytochrome c family protein
MRRRLLLALALGALLAGCGGATTVTPQAETVIGSLPQQATKTVNVAKGDAAKGKVIFTKTAQPQCSSCHTFKAAGSTAKVGPNLDPGLQGKTAQFVLHSITDPSAEVTAGFSDIMPKTYGTQLDTQQLADLVAFLQSKS